MKYFIPVLTNVIRTKHCRKKLNPCLMRGKVRSWLMCLGNLLGMVVMDPNGGTQTNLNCSSNVKRWHLTGIMGILEKYTCQATSLCTSSRKNNWVYMYLPVRVSKIKKSRINFALKNPAIKKLSQSSKPSSLKINYNIFICQLLIQTSKTVALLFLLKL